MDSEKNRSCATQLIAHTNNIFTQQIAGKEVDCVYLDYSKAFDKVDHNLLLIKLFKIGIRGNFIKWIQNFIKGRIQKVVVDNCLSYPTTVISGVPQGSVLGPTLFSVSINDLPKYVKDCDILTYADDTKLIKTIDSTHDATCLQQSLSKVLTWSKQNNMELNKDKFEMMSFRLNSQESNLKILELLPFPEKFRNYKISNENLLTPSEAVRDLGIMIDSELNWNVHRNNICRKSRQMSGWILNTFYTRKQEPLITLFKSLIRPILEFGCEIWIPYKIKDICEIEQIQRSYTSKISDIRLLNYWDRLEKLEISSLQRRRELIILTTIWKIKNNLYPNTINITFKLHPRSQKEEAVLPPLPRTN